MPDDNVVKRILQFKVTGIRKRGRPRLRRTDSVKSDLGIINEKTWRTKLNVRSLWRKPKEDTDRPTRGISDDDDDDIYIYIVAVKSNRHMCKN
ncbi:hypothetical protein TNCV_859891 [Trichonephila clavipes]|nr:hypothetical protein TNCV_859891 [Trichonephila clavipes]